MKTKCGKNMHFVGKGICGLDIFQIEEKDGIWRLGKHLDACNIIEIFGSKNQYEMGEEDE